MLLNMLKGKPVLSYRTGVWPNQSEVKEVQQRFPNSIVRVEWVHTLGAPHATLTIERRH